MRLFPPFLKGARGNLTVFCFITVLNRTIPNEILPRELKYFQRGNISHNWSREG